MPRALIRTFVAAGVAIVAACSATRVAPEPDVSFQIDFQLLHEQMQARFPAERLEVLERWRELLSELIHESPREQLLRVNEFFHRNVRYEEDEVLYGVEDYWATPLETLGYGRGDCEDWAIAKYVSLRRLGIPDRKLRLIYVRAQIGGPRSPLSQAHMVLGYYESPNAEPLILDSLLSTVMPASERPDLSPVFSFNADGLWVGQGATPAAGTPTARLSHWRDVIDRMHREGIRLE